MLLPLQKGKRGTESQGDLPEGTTQSVSSHISWLPPPLARSFSRMLGLWGQEQGWGLCAPAARSAREGEDSPIIPTAGNRTQVQAEVAPKIYVPGCLSSYYL